MLHKLLKTIDTILVLAFIIIGSTFLGLISLLFVDYLSRVSATLEYGFMTFVSLSIWMWVRKDFMEIAEDIFKKAK